MRFQTKIKDRQAIDQLLGELSVSTESSYLWCHHDGRLIIYDAHLSSWDSNKRRMTFQLGKGANKLPLASLTQLNLFHESLLLIFKSPIENQEGDSLLLKAPEAILKLAQAEDFLPELMAAQSSDSSVDANDLELISQVLEVINSNPLNSSSEESKPTTSGPTYVFAKKPEIKETTGAFAFSNKGVVEENIRDALEGKTSGNKKMRIGLSKPGASPGIYPLTEVETHKVAFQTIVKGEFKVGDEIVIHSIYDNPLTNPLKAKIIVFNRPSEYAKHWRVEARFDAAKDTPDPVKKKEIEKVGLKRLLAEETYSHEMLYTLSDMNTNGLIFIEKRKGEFTKGDRLIISNLYNNPLKKPINAHIKSFQDAKDGRLVVVEFLKPED